MGHCIGYFDFKKGKNDTKNILAELNDWAYDPMETDGYHGGLTFHYSPVYATRDKAQTAIKKMDRGWYDDHAVLYKDGNETRWLVKYEYHC